MTTIFQVEISEVESDEVLSTLRLETEYPHAVHIGEAVVLNFLFLRVAEVVHDPQRERCVVYLKKTQVEAEKLPVMIGDLTKAGFYEV